MYNNKSKFNKRFTKKDDNAPKKEDTTPVHLKNVVFLIRNNAEIRHYTSLAMIKILKEQNKDLLEKNIFIKFLDKKYAVCYDGLSVEYRYNNNIFIIALAASFSIFAATASKTINEFLVKEEITISNNEIETIATELIDALNKE